MRTLCSLCVLPVLGAFGYVGWRDLKVGVKHTFLGCVPRCLCSFSVITYNSFSAAFGSSTTYPFGLRMSFLAPLISTAVGNILQYLNLYRVALLCSGTCQTEHDFVLEIAAPFTGLTAHR
jgi:hypothetical protein